MLAAIRRRWPYDCAVHKVRPSSRHLVATLGAAGVIALVACGGPATGATASSAGQGRVTTTGASAPATTTSPGASGAAAAVPGGNWTTFDYNAQRSGVGPADTGITAANLHLLRRRTIQLDGTVDSAPVELHAVAIGGRTRDVIIVTTDYGRTIALDARTGAKLWQFQPSGYARLAGSAQFTTATPVIDPDLRYVYVSSPNGLVHKLLIATGRPVWSTSVTFDATHEKIAGSLNITGGSLVVVTGGYIGDIPPYQGHVVLINRRSGHITAVWNSLCSNRRHLIDPPSSCSASDSAIFGRAGSVIEPNGDILVATGNAPFNGTTNWGDSVLELSPSLHLLHNYTPVNQAYLNNNDVDLGSTSPALLGNTSGPPLAVMAGKDGLVKLLDLDKLDGTAGPAGPRTGGQLQELPAPGSTQVFATPAVWSGPAGRINVYYATANGTADYVLRADDRLAIAWQNDTPGTSPIIAGGLLYIYDQSDGLLKIYNPVSGAVLASLPAAQGHWNSPIVVGGRIILPEGNDNNHLLTGTLDIYHLPGY